MKVCRSSSMIFLMTTILLLKMFNSLIFYVDTGHYMCAKFHFVDLAGSERAHRTGNVGDRFKGMHHLD